MPNPEARRKSVKEIEDEAVQARKRSNSLMLRSRGNIILKEDYFKKKGLLFYNTRLLVLTGENRLFWYEVKKGRRELHGEIEFTKDTVIFERKDNTMEIHTSDNIFYFREMSPGSVK